MPNRNEFAFKKDLQTRVEKQKEADKNQSH